MGGGVDRKQGGSSLVHDRLCPGPGLGPGKRTLTEQLEPVQRRASSEASGPTGDVQTAAAHGTSGPAGALPHLDPIQRAFGHHDVSHVKGHTGSAASEGAAAMGAQAFATGDHVAFADTPDLHTTAHEAAHVVQQRGGVQLKGGVGETGDAYERHADQVANAVVAGRSAELLLDQHASSGGGRPPCNATWARAARTLRAPTLSRPARPPIS